MTFALRRLAWQVAAACGLILSIGQTSAQTSAQTSVQTPAQAHARVPLGPVLLEVTGEVVTPLGLDRDALLALKRVEFSERRTVEQGGKSVELQIKFQGVLLRDLLDQAGLKPDRRQIRKALVLLTAKDGYQASFSWGELYNSALGDGVVVVLRHGPDELLDTEGFPSLRSLQDLRPGPRHVRWLTKIEVRLPAP